MASSAPQISPHTAAHAHAAHGKATAKPAQDKSKGGESFADMLAEADAQTQTPAARPKNNVERAAQSDKSSGAAEHPESEDGASPAEAVTAQTTASMNIDDAPAEAEVEEQAAVHKDDAPAANDNTGTDVLPPPSQPIQPPPQPQMLAMTVAPQTAPAQTPDTQDQPVEATDGIAAAPVAGQAASVNPGPAREARVADETDASAAAQEAAAAPQDRAAPHALAADTTGQKHTARPEHEPKPAPSAQPQATDTAPQQAVLHADAAASATPTDAPANPAPIVPAIAPHQPAQIAANSNLPVFATAAPDTAARDLPTPNFDSLAVDIASRTEQGAKQFDIRLDPPELGRVEVRLSIDATGKAEAHLSADKPQTLDLLQKDAAVLTRALRDAGLDVSQNGLNFSLRQQQGNGGQDQPQQGGRGHRARFQAPGAIESSTASAAHAGRALGLLDIRV